MQAIGPNNATHKTAASVMEAAVLFQSCWGKMCISFNGSKLVVRIARNPCKPWRLTAKSLPLGEGGSPSGLTDEGKAGTRTSASLGQIRSSKITARIPHQSKIKDF